MLLTASQDRPDGWITRRPLREAMTDLVSRIASDRSDAAFRRLVDEFGPKIRGYMMRQGADTAQAEELMQETLITVWRKAALYSPDKGSVATWIFTIARNLRTDQVRRQRPWQALTDEHSETIPADETPADDHVDEGLRRMRVQKVLKELPPEQLAVVELAFMDGLPHSEIADRLGLPLGTVKSRIRLAYQKLRGSLEDLR
jgi:RNA polymerase sigma-70 factor (ECF subfamily)